MGKILLFVLVISILSTITALRSSLLYTQTNVRSSSRLQSVSTLSGIEITQLSSPQSKVDLGQELAKRKGKTLLILGTYAADFNAIEYAQRARHYQKRLQEKGIANILLVLNAEPTATNALAQFLDLPPSIELFSDPLGTAGKAYGCGRGIIPLSIFSLPFPLLIFVSNPHYIPISFCPSSHVSTITTGYEPDNSELNPYLKLFLMLFGLGAWATLPSVIGGYIGNPFTGTISSCHRLSSHTLCQMDLPLTHTLILSLSHSLTHFHSLAL